MTSVASQQKKVITKSHCSRATLNIYWSISGVIVAFAVAVGVVAVVAGTIAVVAVAVVAVAAVVAAGVVVF